MVVAGDACGSLGISGLEAAGDFIGISFHGYASTHLDSFCHLFTDGLMYNGIPASEVKSTGARRNTVMAVQNGIVGRGVLLDIPRFRGVRWLDPGELITPEELDAAASAEGVTMEQGDIVLVSTGRDARRADLGPWDPHEVGIAGMTPECGAWFYKNETALLGTDAVADPVPSPPQGKWPMPVHQISLVAMGMPLIDNMALLNLSQACEEAGRWEFAFITSPLRIGGGTGSPVNPMAIL
jgi:kynurenine formamidase